MVAAADAALNRVRAAAGPQASDALGLLAKLIGNIVDHPNEEKFRRLKPDNAKLKEGLFQFDGAVDFLVAVGFTKTADGAYELGGGAAVASLGHACSTIQHMRDMLPREDPIVAGYKAVVAASGQDGGLTEVDKLAGAPEGGEALRTLEKVFLNIRRYPDAEKYRCVNLAKPATQKLLAAVPLMRAAGFIEDTLPSGERCVKLARVDTDVMDRFYAMAMWATLPSPPPSLDPTTPALNHALGAALGLAIGDALGAPLGGRGPFEVTAAEVDKALVMCGGGLWGVAPGQPTGITELAVCLAEELADLPPGAETWPEDELAARYGKWGQSQPFRVDRASRQAFHRPVPASHMHERAKEMNQKCPGSGPLTRCAPIGILAAATSLSPSATADLARFDTALSHPDPAVGNASAAFAVTVAGLIAFEGDRRRALEALREWLEHENSSAQAGGKKGEGGWTHLAKAEKKPAADEGKDSWKPPGESAVAMDVLAGWLKKAFAGEGTMTFSSMEPSALIDGEVGTVEIPFLHAFGCLHRGTGFEEAMRLMLAGGGDSCTNAAAVGALLGAAVGVRGLPQRWVRAVLACDFNEGQFRPPEYRASRLPELVQRICAKSAN